MYCEKKEASVNDVSVALACADVLFSSIVDAIPMNRVRLLGFGLSEIDQNHQSLTCTGQSD